MDDQALLRVQQELSKMGLVVTSMAVRSGCIELVIDVAAAPNLLMPDQAQGGSNGGTASGSDGLDRHGGVPELDARHLASTVLAALDLDGAAVRKQRTSGQALSARAQVRGGLGVCDGNERMLAGMWVC